jgi:hypothetical protein
MPSRGRQIGGCGSILFFIIIIAFYFLSNGQIDLLGGGSDQTSGQDPFPQQQEQPDVSSPVQSNFTPPVPASGSGQTWTIMLYQDADDQILEKDIYVDLNEAERVGSSDRVRIVAQIDRYAGAYSGDGNWTGTRRYYVTQDNDLNAIHSQEVQDLGEVNMSSGGSLVDFVQWSAQNFPADHYMLILSDHGMGWPGGWSDPTGQGSNSNAPLASRLGNNLYLNELDDALQRSRQVAGIDKFDIIGMDACLMAQIEVMAALQPHGKIAVASEETEPALGWAYASFLGDLVTNPDMSGEELSQRIVASYIEGDQRIADPAARADFLGQGGSPLGGIFGFNPASADQVIAQLEQKITISAVDLEAFPVLMQSVNNFAYTLQQLHAIVYQHLRARRPAGIHRPGAFCLHPVAQHLQRARATSCRAGDCGPETGGDRGTAWVRKTGIHRAFDLFPQLHPVLFASCGTSVVYRHRKPVRRRITMG